MIMLLGKVWRRIGNIVTLERIFCLPSMSSADEISYFLATLCMKSWKQLSLLMMSIFSRWAFPEEGEKSLRLLLLRFANFPNIFFFPFLGPEIHKFCLEELVGVGGLKMIAWKLVHKKTSFLRRFSSFQILEALNFDSLPKKLKQDKNFHKLSEPLAQLFSQCLLFLWSVSHAFC